LAGAVFKAMDEPISEWESKINQWRDLVIIYTSS
jgi:hypothetical protein